MINYFKNKSKRQIIMTIFLTLSVMSSISYASASDKDKCFPAGKELLINTTNVSDWYKPYMYMFGPNNNIWIKMEPHIKNNYFIVLFLIQIIIPD